MKRIVIPTQSCDDWKRLLAKPDLHWREGFSAMTLARCWEASHPSVPPEIRDCLRTANEPGLDDLELLLAIPEYQVDLPGGRRPSQTDVLALMRGSSGLVAVAVEGKVDEAFGPTVGEKRAEYSSGVNERLAWLTSLFELDEVPDFIRYQLMHRTASALLVANQFDASAAVMLVHSFSPTGKWFDDYASFLNLFGAEAEIDHASQLGFFSGIPLFVGWAKGDERFRARI